MKRLSETHKRKIGEANAISLKDKPKSEEHIEAIRQGALTRPKKSCKICSNEYSNNVIAKHEKACARKAEVYDHAK